MLLKEVKVLVRNACVLFDSVKGFIEIFQGFLHHILLVALE